VEEVDVDKLKEMVKVKDEDIAKLDQYATAKKGSDARENKTGSVSRSWPSWWGSSSG
jgi:hypothetical protein